MNLNPISFLRQLFSTKVITHYRSMEYTLDYYKKENYRLKKMLGCTLRANTGARSDTDWRGEVGTQVIFTDRALRRFGENLDINIERDASLRAWEVNITGLAPEWDRAIASVANDEVLLHEGVDMVGGYIVR